MRVWLRMIAALTVVILAAGATVAQAQQPPQPPRPPQPPGIGGPLPGLGASPQLMLLNHKPVQEELKLTEEQTKKIAEMSAKQQELFKGGITPELMKKLPEMAQETEKAVADALKPEQLKRLRQLELQQRGAMAFFDPRVMKELGVTPEQQAKVGSAIAESFKKRAEALKDIKGDFKELQKRLEEMNRGTLEDLVKLLTPEQQMKWKDLQGEPFKGTLPGGFGGAMPFPPPPPGPPEIRPPGRPDGRREPPGILPPAPPL